ncbi:twitching motility protein PilT [Vibrio cholerae]|nr:twitching motility protein PilT [Vibrio cholerae]
MDIAELLEFSVKHNASDLHLSAGVPPMVGLMAKLGSLAYLLLPILMYIA